MTSSPEPLQSKGGRLTAIFLAVVGLAVIVGAFMLTRDDDSAAEDDLYTPPGGFLSDVAAADFSVDLIGGGTFSLTDHLASDSRPVVLNFWASWCPPCRAEMPDFDLVARHRNDVLIIGIAVEDDPDNAEDFASEIAVSYPLGIDVTGTIGAKYPYVGLPTSYFINRDGVIVHQLSGMLSFKTLNSLIDTHLTG